MKKKLIFVLSLLLMFLTLGFKVNAQTYVEEFNDKAMWIPNTYIKKMKNGRGSYQQLTMITKKSNNQFVYCIEAGVTLDSSKTYQGQDYDQSFFASITPENWRRIQLLMYYGYGYVDSEVNHSDIKWYSVTQFMIWQTVPNGFDIYFTDGANGPRIYGKFADEMEEMERLIQKHYIQPHFDIAEETVTNMVLGSTLTLTDQNSVLANYSVEVDNDVVGVKVNGNSLSITANNLGSAKITLTKKDQRYSHPSIVYVDPVSQNIGEVGSYDPITITLHIHTIGSKVSIQKVDKESGIITPQGQASLQNAKYGVFREDGTKIQELITNQNGYAISDYLPSVGRYYVMEISPPKGYQLDSEKHYFEVTSETTEIPLRLEEQVIKGKIKITKVDSETKSCSSQGKSSLKGSKFKILNSKNEIVDTVMIGDDCTATSKDLPYDSYTVQEIQAGTGYKLNNSIFQVEILDESTQEITVTNDVIKGKIKITKADSETKSCSSQGQSSLKGSKFKILNSKNEIVDTVVIGDDCTVTSKDLPYDSYTVQEIQAGTGYKLNNSIFQVDILEESIQEITVTNDVVKGKIKITKVDSETKSCSPQGEALLKGAKYQIIDSHDNVVDTLIIGDDCTATSKLLPYDDYTIKEISNSKGYYLNTKIYSSSIIEEVEYPVTVTEDVIKNKFNFYKFYGNQNTGMIYAEANAEFDIINNKNEVVAHIKTDTDGKADVVLPYGTYTVKQTKGLDEYKMVAPFTITVSENTALTQNNFIKNGEITARLKLIKIDSKTKKVIPIAGAKFKIKNKANNEYVCLTTDKTICEFETNKDGIMITPLPLYGGNYIIEEIKAPEGYLLSSKTKEFSILKNTEIVEDDVFGSLVVIEFENEEVVGKLEIQKKGEKVVIEDGNFKYEEVSLPNVKFGLYDAKGNLVGEYTTDENGYLKVENLKLGKYTLKELETVDGYVLDGKIYEFELVYKDQYTPVITKSYTLKNYLEKSSFEFSKKDLVTGEPLPNTKIQIFSYTDDEENGTLIYEGVTDKNGTVVIKDLFVGKFFLCESEAPEGYILNPEKMYFEITENGKVVKAEMVNEKIKSIVKLHKIDEDGNALEGVTIGVYDIEGNLLGSSVTDENGDIEVELEYGSYYFQEIETVDGYVLSDEKVYFDVTIDGEIIQKTLVNELEEIEVPNTLKNDYLPLGMYTLIISGIGTITYGIFKKKKIRKK